MVVGKVMVLMVAYVDLSVGLLVGMVPGVVLGRLLICFIRSASL